MTCPTCAGTGDRFDPGARLARGDRQDTHGHPSVNLGRTGRMWAAILGVPDVTAQQVALCMIAVKVSREINKPAPDNRDDINGYVECLRMMEGEATP